MTNKVSLKKKFVECLSNNDSTDECKILIDKWNYQQDLNELNVEEIEKQPDSFWDNFLNNEEPVLEEKEEEKEEENNNSWFSFYKQEEEELTDSLKKRMKQDDK